MRAHTQVHLIEVRGSVSFVSVCWSPPGPSRVIVGDSASSQPGRAAASRQGPARHREETGTTKSQ